MKSAFGVDHGEFSKNFRMPGSFAPTISKPVQPVKPAAGIKPQKPGNAIQKPQMGQGAQNPMQRFMANRRPSMGGPVRPGMTSQAGRKPMGQSMMQPRSPMSWTGQGQPGQGRV